MNKKMLIISLWGYPGGGGEAFLYQTMEWANKLNFEIFWICFCMFNLVSYIIFEVIKEKYGTIIQIPNGFNENTIKVWTKLLRPDIIHIQGHKKLEILRSITPSRIPILMGYHFWSGLVDLNSNTFNSEIKKNIKNHKISDEYKIVSKNKFVSPYVCSDFMNEILEGIGEVKLPIIYPSSSIEENFTGKRSFTEIKFLDLISKRKFITVCNIHRLKGGEIIYKLLNKIKYPFICIQTESNSEDIDKKIKDVITYRKNQLHIEDKYLNYCKNMKEIYSITKILLIPSLVDETFCRVANEGLMNGIPIITTGVGNISNLVREAGIIISHLDIQEWEKQINLIMTNDNLYQQYSDKSMKQYELFSEEIAFNQFKNLTFTALKKSKENRIMILVPYCDQGLGIQARNYYNILKSLLYEVFIFSFTPYHTEKTGNALTFQKNKDEWVLSEPDSIYYSPNTRENITDKELYDFINDNNIGKCLLPETCWKRVFEIAHFLRKINVKCYAIPNIEIVRKDEIYKYRYFYKVLCNNMLCYNFFEYYGYKNIEYIGYGIPLIKSLKPKIYTDRIKFLCIGGMNAFSRKNIKEVCQAFSKLPSSYFKKNSEYDEEKASLTVTVQKYYNGELENYKSNKNINIITDHLSNTQIQKLYREADVCIQISKKEGLGLGFYEALNNGLPVITLNVSPHNEIIKENYNGWYVKSSPHKMEDNNDALYDEFWVDVADLTKVMKYVIDCGVENIEKMSERITNDLEKKYLEFENNFEKSLN